MKLGTVIALDNAIEQRFNGLAPLISELTPLVKERMALLRVAEAGDIVEGIGVRYNSEDFVVHET